MNQKLAIKVFELLMLERDDIRKLKKHNIFSESEKTKLGKMEDRIVQLMELTKEIINEPRSASKGIPAIPHGDGKRH